MFYTIIILICCPYLGYAMTSDRQDRSFSLFTVLKWKNSGCQAVSDTALQGICNTQQQCTDIGGSADGNCAAGFGVCCILVVSGTTASPGGTVTQNCSYIQNVDYPAAEGNSATYDYPITKCSSDICQIRLDFVDANLAQPVAATGVCTAQDSMRFTAGGGETIPELCGDLQGQHIYMDAGTNSMAGMVTITTNMGNAAGGTKNWRIKVSQIECSSETRAPNGCLQYYLENRNVISSFNWDGSAARSGSDGGLLANQDYRSCIRQNEGMCGIQWTEATVTGNQNAFDLNAANNPELAQHTAANCVIATNGGSYVQIPGTSIANCSTGDMFCGDFFTNFVAMIAAEGANQSGAVFATGLPFDIRTVSVGNANAEAGYSLVATQVPCGVNPTGHNQCV